jgi:hypothetical protein
MLISLFEVNGRTISDSAVLSAIIIPNPTIEEFSTQGPELKTTYITAFTSDIETNRGQKYSLDLALKLSNTADSALISKFRYAVSQNTICKLGNLYEERGNSTWGE